jgi:hypothetical protein
MEVYHFRLCLSWFQEIGKAHMSLLFCPLCLQRLDDGSVLEMYCMEHFGEPRDIPCTANFTRTLQCSSSCRANKRIDRKPLIFLHQNCPVQFPYDRIPAHAAILQATVRGTATDIEHWQIGVLTQLAGRMREPGPMFFPLAALLATSEERRQRGSAIVGLSGDQEVGKTVLAVQSMTRLGYGTTRKLHATVHNFIYAQPGEEDLENTEFFNLLHLVSDRNATLAWRNPDATRAQGVNIKAIMFSPMDRARHPAPSSGPADPGRPENDDMINMVKRKLVGNLKEISSSVGEALKKLSPADTPTLFLYDSPGEHASSPRDPLFNLDNYADVIAVAVEAQDIWKPRPFAPHQSLRKANGRLQRVRQALESAARPKARICLIVTKLDTVPELMEKAAPHLDSFAEADAEALRRLAIEGLRGSAEDEHFDDVMGQLEHRDIDRVFMIATSNLDPAVSGGRPPVTIGLAPFIVWALRIPAAELFAE